MAYQLQIREKEKIMEINYQEIADSVKSFCDIALLIASGKLPLKNVRRTTDET